MVSETGQNISGSTVSARIWKSGDKAIFEWTFWAFCGMDKEAVGFFVNNSGVRTLPKRLIVKTESKRSKTRFMELRLLCRNERGGKS